MFGRFLIRKIKFGTKLNQMPKVLITCGFNDKIFGYHFLVHEGCMIMMFYVPQEPKSCNRKFYH